jgi:hypothetical protein
VKRAFSRKYPARFSVAPGGKSERAQRQERPVTNAQEKRINRIAERNGFRLDKVGSGKGHGRFYIVNLTEGQRMRSGILDHEYSFSLEEAEAWLATHSK